MLDTRLQSIEAFGAAPCVLDCWGHIMKQSDDNKSYEQFVNKVIAEGNKGF